MAEFFPSPGGLALFVNAGDPPLDVLDGLVDMLDEAGVDCLELAVPFPGSVTDGPVVRRSADRALAQGVGLTETLAFVARVRPRLRRLRIALLADWSHSLKGRPLPEAVARIADAGVDGLLVHALPPRLGEQYHDAARQARLPVVTTCYHGRSAESLAAAAAGASAYVYLVAHYGRSGTAPAAGYADLAGSIARLRERTAAPVAVGFGVKTRADVAAIHAAGAHAAIVGSAGVARIEQALDRGHDVVARLRDFVAEIHPVTTPRRAS
ncbi:tryptophan synthase subunit alpha [Spirilliplanes yamanashiensis]|uniref:tryptophan synthase n=1 Tax=Spirilliplanes yamanashiensis TaxID=42233 RepID=A0A8J4DIE2_9ACTN|nr:tryptophan synthase subunit alpha [Spirilliplanes yamanashiensis]MDP9819317.1 tryptophan synthase alpha chain [Spirilliplanes yamanashiensis]GIJ01860.1 tryptophan synthase alpha chain [Spirilliplanes yamanashiensis]